MEIIIGLMLPLFFIFFAIFVVAILSFIIRMIANVVLGMKESFQDDKSKNYSNPKK